MIKAAIEKILECARPRTFEAEGEVFLADGHGNCKQVRKALDKVERIGLNSLDALVELVKTEACMHHGKLYITIPSHKSVECFTQPLGELRNERVYLYEASATDVPGWGEKNTLPFEEAMIALRTRFQPTADTEYALKLLSDITTGSKVTYNDNGVATSVVTKRGIDLQSNAAIRPIISLRPYRTFQEVEQPASQFLIRINERGIAFIEADGGMWKLEARRTVKAYLERALAEEVACGQVSVVL